MIARREMPRLYPLLRGFALSILLTLVACDKSSIGNTLDETVTISVTPQITTLDVNASQQFSATTTGPATKPTWYLYPQGTTIASRGSISAGGLYTAPGTPPVYTTGELESGLQQGKVVITGKTTGNGVNPLGYFATSNVILTITGPISVGISPPTAMVTRGNSTRFTGYSVGSIDGALTWQVNGVTGGSVTYGTINTNGDYFAPPVVPVTGPDVTITAIAHADPTQTASATVTIQ